ncbi:MAG: hypothetical protein Tsb0013_23650 [Phycisphaerales bacterium]
MSGGREVISVTLRAHTAALEDERVRATVESAARALAERQGVELVELTVDETSLHATLVGPEVVGVGFVSELRRSTEAWYARRTNGATLWGTPGT